MQPCFVQRHKWSGSTPNNALICELRKQNREQSTSTWPTPSGQSHGRENRPLAALIEPFGMSLVPRH